MNISIIGPENSGKSTLAATLAKKCAFGRPIYIIGGERSQFQHLDVEDFKKPENAVVIIDDTNAFLEDYDLRKRDNDMKRPIVKSRWMKRVNIFVFHSEADAVKFMLRLSRYVYISKKYRDKKVKKNQYIADITPEEVGREPFIFLRFKRY